VVAAGTLFLEQKFIRNAGVAGHIEDVVVDTTVRGLCQFVGGSLCKFTTPCPCPYLTVLPTGLSSSSGKGLGKGIIDFLTDVARRSGCYKVILDCDESNTGFYAKCGYSGGHSPVYMAVYF
jgi:glucosamine-phosphate N-acetyltransferase